MISKIKYNVHNFYRSNHNEIEIIWSLVLSRQFINLTYWLMQNLSIRWFGELSIFTKLQQFKLHYSEHWLFSTMKLGLRKFIGTWQFPISLKTETLVLRKHQLSVWHVKLNIRFPFKDYPSITSPIRKINQRKWQLIKRSSNWDFFEWQIYVNYYVYLFFVRTWTSLTHQLL